jgi:hypothetical protein
MKSPIHISLDTEVPGGAGYVRYSHGKAVRQDALDEAFSVAVDLDAVGDVVGIELTLLDERAFGLARIAAHRYDLRFPDLAASLGAA